MAEVGRSWQKGMEHHRRRPNINVNSIDISATVRWQKLAEIGRNWQKGIGHYRRHSNINVNSTDISTTVNADILV